MALTEEQITDEAAIAAQIAEQNDRFRRSWGADFTVPGRIVITQGVAALGDAALIQMMVAVQQFSTFTEDNDPYGNHDFGIFTVPTEGSEVRLYWKIDLYDAAFEYGSEAPADPSRTRRVLTILLPEEY